MTSSGPAGTTAPAQTPMPGTGGGRSRVLTVNGGSTSLKFALFEPGDPPTRVRSGKVERIGTEQAKLSITAGDSGPAEEIGVAAPDHTTAAGLVAERLGGLSAMERIAAVGHRVVHGGGRFSQPTRVDQALLDELRRISPYDPDHLPAEIALIQAFGRLRPAPPQVACFDTAFHHDMPRVAQIVPIPRRYEADGIRRYGFHGISYAFLMEELARTGGEAEARGRVILAHLGAGASMAAVREGRCLDTTMAFTPTAGLVMATRTGDIDPGLVTYLMRTKGMDPAQFNRLVNRESGLLGVSETSGDVRDLLTREGSDPRAVEALDLFCYRARQWIGALAATLDGVETLVFAGGIGENSPPIRRRICDGLAHLGVRLDAGRNEAGGPLISADGAPVRVRVIRTDEELMIARATLAIVAT